MGQGTLDRIRPARFHSRKFNPAHLSSRTLQKGLLAISDSLKFFEAQLRGTKFTILTDYKPLETFMDRIRASQKLRQWQEFLVSSDQTIVHTAGKKNFITDSISAKYIRIGTLTEDEDFISGSIANPTLHGTPTLSTPAHTITYDHFSIPPLTSDMLEYESSARDISHTECKCNLCRRRGKAAGHQHTCPYQDDDDWEQFVSDPEHNEFQEISLPTEPQEPDNASLTRIDPAIFERYTPLSVEQIGLEAYKEDIVRMY